MFFVSILYASPLSNADTNLSNVPQSSLETCRKLPRTVSTKSTVCPTAKIFSFSDKSNKQSCFNEFTGIIVFLPVYCYFSTTSVLMIWPMNCRCFICYSPDSNKHTSNPTNAFNNWCFCKL